MSPLQTMFPSTFITRNSSQQQYGFWSGNPALRNQDILQISMFGDSIIAGSFNEPNASRIWTPQATAKIIAGDNARTIVTGSQLWPASGYTMSSGAGHAAGVFTLTASVGDTNPRFTTSVPTAIAYAPGKLYRMRAEIDTTNSVGKHLALRGFGRTAAGGATSFGDYNFGGDDEDTGGYVPVAGVLSMDYGKSLAANMDLLALGGEIAGTNTSGVGLIRNIEVYELSRGVAVINQGVSGNDASDGLTRVATVTAWTPDVCIVAFGTNDIRESPNDLSGFIAALTDIHAALDAAGVYVVFATIPPLAADQANYDDVPAWNAAIEALAIALGCGFWDRWAALDNGDLSYIEDGRHPSRAGYLKLAADAAYQIAGVTA